MIFHLQIQKQSYYIKIVDMKNHNFLYGMNVIIKQNNYRRTFLSIQIKIKNKMQLCLQAKPIKTSQSKTTKVDHLGIRMKTTQSSHFNQWRQIKTPSSQINSRFHHASVINDGNIYVYGGFDNNHGILSDFKMFRNDGTYKWVDLPVVNGPGPRHSHSAVVYQGIIYIFGGKIDRLSSTNQVHAYQIATQQWNEIQTQGSLKQIPKGTDSHQSLLYNNQMIILGGFSNNEFTNDVYSLNLETKKWRKLYQTVNVNYHEIDNKTQMEPRSDFSMVLYNNKLYIYAGKNLYNSFNDLWQFDLDTLHFDRVVSNKMPNQYRSGHTAIVYKQYMIIFGGITSVTHERNDLLSYSFEKKEWKIIWENSERKLDGVQEFNKKTPKKRLSNIRNSLQNAIYDQQDISKQKEKIRKYRRPLAEQNETDIKIHINFYQTKKHKKLKQRKIMLINNIQASIHPNEQLRIEKCSPLIESLTNSIMLTSTIHHGNGINRQSGISKSCEEYEKKIKIKARDGHTAHLIGNQMVVFGGDRHMIGINDVTFLNLQLIINKQDKQLLTVGYRKDKIRHKTEDNHQGIRFSQNENDGDSND